MNDNIMNPSRPMFVKIEGFQAAGKIYKAGERFNWEFLKVPLSKVQILFNQGFIHHNPELEEKVAQKVSIGDGLEEFSVDELQVLVGNINAKVKAKVNPKDFMAKHCKESKIKDKQIALIRTWRRNFGDLEND